MKEAKCPRYKNATLPNEIDGGDVDFEKFD